MKLTVNQQGNLVALAVTIVFTLLFFTLMAFIHVKPHVVYNEITIDLASTPVVEEVSTVQGEKASQEKEIAPVDSDSPSEKIAEDSSLAQSTGSSAEDSASDNIPVNNMEESAPAVAPSQIDSVQENSKPSQPLQTSPSSSEKGIENVKPESAVNPSPDQKTEVIQNKNPSENKAQSTKTKKTAQDIWDEMENENEKNYSTSEKAKVNSSASSFEGTAASSSSDNQKSQVLSSQSQKGGQHSSEATSQALEEIKTSKKVDTRYTGDTASTINFDHAANKGSGFNVNGKFRALKYPSSPSITLSKEAAEMIASTVTVTIRFGITASGTVTLSSITFSPGAALPPAVQSEIAGQIQSWLFTEGESGTAVMNYTIQKN